MDLHTEITRLQAELTQRDETISQLQQQLQRLATIPVEQAGAPLPPPAQTSSQDEELLQTLVKCQQKLLAYEAIHTKWRGVSEKLSTGNVRAEKLRQMLKDLDNV